MGKQDKIPGYKSWDGMKQRCYNPNNKDFIDYGFRGIKVCDRWLESFQNFISDMGEKPKGLEVDRKDNNGDYEPANCHWATRKEQIHNRRRQHNARIINYKGEERELLEVCKELNFDFVVACSRYHRHWLPEYLFSPVLKRVRHG